MYSFCAVWDRFLRCSLTSVYSVPHNPLSDSASHSNLWVHFLHLPISAGTIALCPTLALLRLRFQSTEAHTHITVCNSLRLSAESLSVHILYAQTHTCMKSQWSNEGRQWREVVSVWGCLKLHTLSSSSLAHLSSLTGNSSPCTSCHHLWGRQPPHIHPLTLPHYNLSAHDPTWKVYPQNPEPWSMSPKLRYWLMWCLIQNKSLAFIFTQFLVQHVV